MASNYFNSSGTDLDNLFYVNNSNGGGVGYLTNNGQDLGNRYSNSSTLGTTIGYYNSAGTDLGYLRGNLTVPTITASITKNNTHYDQDSDGCSGPDCPTHCSLKIPFYGMVLNINKTNTMPITNINLSLEAEITNRTSGSLHLIVCGKYNTLTYTPSMLFRANCAANCECYTSMTKTDSSYNDTDFLHTFNNNTIYTSIGNKSIGQNLTYNFTIGAVCLSTAHIIFGSAYCNIKAKITSVNAAGSYSVYTNIINLGFIHDYI